MKKTAYICGYYNFPRGSASANYVQYLGLALKDIGYNIVLITNTNNDELSSFQHEHGDIFDIRSYSVRTGKIGHYIDMNYSIGRYIRKELSKSNLTPDDLLISYSFDKSVNEAVLSFASKFRIKSAVCVVELFAKEDFEPDRGGIKYKKYKYTIDNLIPRFDIIFPISSFIEEYYRKKRCSVYRLPIMADPFEYEYQDRKGSDILRFVYPANGKMKDSLTNMVYSINSFSDIDLDKMEFHFCGIKKSVIEGLLDERLKKRIGRTIVIHNWMKYKELVDLYRSVDFLFLARDVSQMTLANFPSKVPEAMCYGVIPVVSRVGDYIKLYLKDNENSIIFDGCNVDACQKAINRCLMMSHVQIARLRNASRQASIDIFYYKRWEKAIYQAISES